MVIRNVIKLSRVFFVVHLPPNFRGFFHTFQHLLLMLFLHCQFTSVEKESRHAS